MTRGKDKSGRRDKRVRRPHPSPALRRCLVDPYQRSSRLGVPAEVSGWSYLGDGAWMR